MSLDWTINTIDNYMEACWEPISDDYQPSYDETTCEEDGKRHKLRSVTQALIFATMAIGIGTITMKNLHEVQVRLELWQDVVGALLTRATGKGLKPVRVTAEDVARHVGLSTNVYRDSWSVFYKKLRQVAERRIAA